MKKISKNIIYLTIGLLALVAVLVFASTNGAKPAEVSLSKVIEQTSADQVEKIEVTGDKLLVTLKDGTKEQSFKEKGTSLSQYGIDYKKVKVDPKNPDDATSKWLDIVLAFLPIAIIIGFFYFIMRQAQGSNNQALSFGKSRARVFGLEKGKVKFRDVAGVMEAKAELQEVVEFLKYPAKFESLGARIPKGVLLVGAPGTGKTLLARAVAGEAGVPFFNISGSEFVEMFVGVGASRVRDLFNKAKKNAPCIVFIDEIDAVGRQRGTGLGGGHDEREQTLNQILVEMDGFEQGTNIIVMAATNRPDVLDPALLRPGRFDRRVMLDLPDMKSRAEILKVHSEKKPLDKDVDLMEVSRKTPGLSGADLANIANEAAIFTARSDRKKITRADFHEAVEKIALGPERKSRILSDKEKKITAYHEAGHALISHMLPNCHPVHKVSIVSRGMAGGVTWSLPVEDKHLHSVAEFKDELAMALGGRVAEKLIFGDITTGAESDLKHANNLARKMITEYGMGSKLTNLVFGENEGSVFLGRTIAEGRSYSEEVASEIDQEISRFIKEASDKAEKTIKANRAKLNLIADKLIEKETLEGKEFEKLIGTKPR
ncbi:MAG: ATP-dependent zinc metalloprotease FtsH [bacterium]|nr:ATP-dependent zinc metalloprotease FtsH [bacterium]